MGFFRFKAKTDKEIEQEIKRESAKYKKEEHTAKLQSELSGLKEAQKKLKHDRFQKKYGGLISGLKSAEKEALKGIKVIKKYSKTSKTSKSKSKRKNSGFKWA